MKRDGGSGRSSKENEEEGQEGARLPTGLPKLGARRRKVLIIYQTEDKRKGQKNVWEKNFTGFRKPVRGCGSKIALSGAPNSRIRVS